MSTRTWFVAALASVLAACTPPAAARAPAPAPAGQTTASAPRAEPSPPGPRERPELTQFFDAENVQGSIALLDSRDGQLTCSNVARCTAAAPPASTFKIPHSAIALELGLLEDAESALPWDGKTYSVPDWNRDHTLRTAMRVSCLPCFQALARREGAAPLADWVSKLEYGNHDTAGGIDRFWLDGALKISPVQQIEFLRRLDQDKLPIQRRTSEIVKDIITLDVGRDHVLRGKTGLVQPPEQARFFGWFVGWVELSERRVYFATLIEAVGPDVDPVPVRRRVTERILRSLDVLPNRDSNP